MLKRQTVQMLWVKHVKKKYKCCEENMFKRQTVQMLGVKHVEKTNSTNVVSKTCLKKQYKCWK